jgi:hypothetical protein
MIRCENEVINKLTSLNVTDVLLHFYLAKNRKYKHPAITAHFKRKSPNQYQSSSSDSMQAQQTAQTTRHKSGSHIPAKITRSLSNQDKRMKKGDKSSLQELNDGIRVHKVTDDGLSCSNKRVSLPPKTVKFGEVIVDSLQQEREESKYSLQND